MIEALIVTLEGPMVSFGGPKIDRRHPSWRHPGLSMIAGLIANALGHDHSEPGRTQALQDRLQIASRADAVGRPMTDYHTADLGLPHMRDDGAWTTRSVREQRGGGSKARTGTHVTERAYLAGARRTVAIALSPGEPGAPGLSDLHAALLEPARPLYLGRKCCPPSAPLVRAEAGDSIVTASDLADALARAPWPFGSPQSAEALWPAGAGIGASEFVAPEAFETVSDVRDWALGKHLGQRHVVRGRIRRPPNAELAPRAREVAT